MRYFLIIFIPLMFCACQNTSHISKQEYNELQNQVRYLKNKVDSLERQLDKKADIESALQHDSLLFLIRKTPCLGPCPEYEFKVYKDGWASYQGKNFVDMLGVYTANITLGQMKQIEDAFRKSHFYAFRDYYDDSRLDIPSIIIEYHGPQGVKKVVARTEIPHSFRSLAVDLEEIADQIKWIPYE